MGPCSSMPILSAPAVNDNRVVVGAKLVSLMQRNRKTTCNCPGNFLLGHVYLPIQPASVFSSIWNIKVSRLSSHSIITEDSFQNRFLGQRLQPSGFGIFGSSPSSTHYSWMLSAAQYISLFKN